MGEAKRRRSEINQLKNAFSEWLSTLPPQEKTIAELAKIAHEKIIVGKNLKGGCYLMTFFLYQYMKNNLGITPTVVIGWVSDGTTPAMISHGWLEYNGKIIDITLNNTEFPDVQIPGEVLILGFPTKQGKVKYTYHRDKSPEAVAALAELEKRMPSEVKRKEAEHEQMVRISSSDDLILDYLRHAPSDRSYKALSKLLQ